MASQARLNVDNTPVFRHGSPAVADSQTIQQDAGRTGADLLPFTVMVRDPTDSNKWLPMSSLTATDGTSIPQGLMLGTVTTAAIVAGDVTGQYIYTKTGFIDEDKIVLENSLALDNVIVDLDMTIRDALRRIDIIPETGIDLDRYENA